MSNPPIKRHRLILEGIDCKGKVSVPRLQAFLVDLSKRINMNLLPLGVNNPNPNGIYVNASTGKEPGCSAWAIWSESGVQIHEWERYHFITLDMFSCKDFKVMDVDALFQYWFVPTELRNCIPVVSSCRG